MKKEARLAMIRDAYRRIYGGTFVGFLPLSKREIKDTVAAVAPIRERDELEVNSQLRFEKAEPARERETDILLNAKERRELRKAMAKPFSPPVAAKIEVEEFPGVDDPYVPIINPQWDVELAPEIEAWAAFRDAVTADSEKLLLMG